MDRFDRMNIKRSDDVTDNERYGSLYLIKQRHNNVNDYGGAVDDVEKLSAITNAAAGSTCLFTNGDIYRLELDGWAEFAENSAGATQAATLTSFAPLTMGRSAALIGTPLPEIEPEFYAENAEPLDTVEVKGDDK